MTFAVHVKGMTLHKRIFTKKRIFGQKCSVDIGKGAAIMGGIIARVPSNQL